MERVDSLPERIQWHEGMLLSPQHFQHESARVDALIAWQALATNPYAWGIRRLELDEGLLATGLLRVLRLDAVMPDGKRCQNPSVGDCKNPAPVPPGKQPLR